MDFFEVVAKRRTVRDFADQPVKEEILRKVLEVGLKAPSNNHLRQWEFILVKDMEIRKRLVRAEKLDDEVDIEDLKMLFKELDPVAKEMYLEAIPKQSQMLLKSPELLVVCYKQKTPINECRRIYDLNGFASIWCCIENILLAMAAEGLYGATYIPEESEAVKEVLQIPEDFEIPAIIPLGYPVENAQFIRQKEVSLRERIHINLWNR